MIQISSTPQSTPRTIFIYGTPGCGKSTLASTIPNVLMIDVERGSMRMACARITAPEKPSWKWFLEAIACAHESKSHDVIVVDTIDRAEKIAEMDVIEGDPKCNGSIANALGGYGKGVAKVRSMLMSAHQLLKDTGKTVIYLAHAGHVKDPCAGGERDVYGPNLHEKTATELMGDCTDVIFTSEKTGESGVLQRVAYTQHTNWCVAKSRARLPAEVPLEWAEIEALPDQELLKKISEIIEKLDPAKRAMASAFMASCPSKYEIQAKFAKSLGAK